MGTHKGTEREVTILNKLGLHARPAAKIVRVTSRFNAEIWIEKDGDRVNGKSILGLMTLAAAQGSKLMIRADGPEAENAIRALEELVEARFDEE